ncbi:MAG TPA: PAS domain S-box protein [Bryobacteraceae bacterium]|nr:PAS domain S-box protein [Bryobacteraceae bacterium]
MRPASHDDGDASLPFSASSAGVSAQDIVGQITEPILLVDSDWRVVFANASATRLLQTAGQVDARTLWQHLPQTLDRELEQRYRHAMTVQAPWRFEHPFRDGAAETWFEVASFPSAAGLLLHYRDITERKRREEEMTAFVEAAGVGLHWVGADGRILWVSETELNLLGYSRDEYVGSNIGDFLADAEDRSAIIGRLARGHGYQVALRCKDGSSRSVLLTANAHGRALAHEAHQRLAAIVESSDDAIVGKNLQGTILSWNRGAERIFGYTASEVIGRHVSMLAVPERVDEIPNILGRISRGERVEHYVTQRRTKDGRVLWVSLTVSPVRDSTGRIVGASKVARDVTEAERHQELLREMNEQLRRANADLQQFAFSAAHDLQEPLRMVSLFTQLLQRQYRSQFGAEADAFMTQTVEAAQRMNRLLQDMLTYTELSASNIPAGEVADPNAAVQTAKANLEAAISESGATIECEELPLVSLRPRDLEQLFQNLIGNAIKYRRADPPLITIGARRRGPDWVFSVKDNGIGIDPQYVDQIFGLFKRLHTAKEYPGTGLGLAICQRIVERAGGRIWVESEPEHGSTFSFTLPIRES